MSNTKTLVTPGMEAGKEPYNREFYDAIRGGSRHSAEVIVPIILELTHPTAVLDVGCGDGTWLSVFRKFGVEDILGLDGEYVDRRLLQILEDQFRPVDLARPFTVDRRFDLAVSLEVAEHLPPESAEGFVYSLTQSAPIVLFSAAIPFQGGNGHLNEQWPEYWCRLFQHCGYATIDCIRASIWNNDAVEFWYAQNCLVFADSAVLERNQALRAALEATDPHRLRRIHPQGGANLPNTRGDPGVKEAGLLLAKALKNAMRKRLRALLAI